MSDIVERLRHSVFFLTDKSKVQEAIAEITRLRAEAERLRMTEKEHEFVLYAADLMDEMEDDLGEPLKPEAATLRALAERHRRDA